jgi:hypothetical protein
MTKIQMLTRPTMAWVARDQWVIASGQMRKSIATNVVTKANTIGTRAAMVFI